MKSIRTLILPSLFLVALAATAEAQIVDEDTGPARVESDDTSSLFTATVTADYDFDFNLKVYHNGTLKYNNTTSVHNSGPTYNYSETVSHVGWGLAVGDTLLYRSKATLTAGPNQGSYGTDNRTVIVSTPTGLRRFDSAPRLPAMTRPSDDWRILE